MEISRVNYFNAKTREVYLTRRREEIMIEIKVCQICGSDAKFMKDSKTHCNCSNKDCLLSGDKYFHVDKWNKRSSESMRLIDIIEDLRLEVTASIDSREQGYIDDLFRKAMDAWYG